MNLATLTDSQLGAHVRRLAAEIHPLPIGIDPNQTLQTDPAFCTLHMVNKKLGPQLKVLATPAGEAICGAYDIRLVQDNGLWVIAMKLVVNLKVDYEAQP